MSLFYHNQKIKDQTFTAIDIETTGLNYTGSEIIEVAGTQFTLDGGIIDTFSSLACPTLPLSLEAQSVNGITNEMLKDAPPLGMVLTQFFQYIGNSVIIAHNAEFDIPFLKYNCLKLSTKFNNNPVICTLILSRQLLGFKKNNLDYLRKQLSIPKAKERTGNNSNFHEALDDSYACWRVFVEIVNRTSGREKPISEFFSHPKGYFYFADYPTTNP